MAGSRLLHLFRVVIIMVFLATGCRSIPPTQTAPSLLTQTGEAAPTNTLTLEPFTLTPSPTPHPPTITPTITLTFTPIPTSQPTLDRTQVTLRVEDLLKTNGNCAPPCLWGLKVGKTSFEQVDAFFQHMDRKGYIERNEKGEISLYNTSFRGRNDTFPIEIVIDFDAGIIKDIRMFIGGLYESGINREGWSAYSLKNILQTYGVPSRVVFAVQQPTEPPYNSGLVAYSYVVHYEAPNVTYFYRGGPIHAGQVYRICPMSPKEAATALWLFFGKHPYGDFRDWVDLSEATSLSLEDFYKVFTEGDEGTCLNLKAKAFQEGST